MTGNRRQSDRRASERRAGSASRALVPAGERIDHAPDDMSPAGPAAGNADGADSSAVFAAQVIGQTGQRKGLKGGPPVLDAARSTYLTTEYSGANERRPRKGGATKTEV